MTCRTAQELITPYLDNRLTGEQMLTVQEHLSTCISCSEEYEMMRQVRLMLRSLRVHQPPPTVEQRLVQTLEDRLGFTTPNDQHFVFTSFTWHRSVVITGAASGRAYLQSGQRGRRLAAALALSAFSVLVVASPFGVDVSGLSARAAFKHHRESGPDFSLAAAANPQPVDLSSIAATPNPTPGLVSNYSSPTGVSVGPAINAGYSTYSASPQPQSFGPSSTVIINHPFMSNVTFAELPGR